MDSQDFFFNNTCPELIKYKNGGEADNLFE